MIVFMQVGMTLIVIVFWVKFLSLTLLKLSTPIERIIDSIALGILSVGFVSIMIFVLQGIWSMS